MTDVLRGPGPATPGPERAAPGPSAGSRETRRPTGRAVADGRRTDRPETAPDAVPDAVPGPGAVPSPVPGPVPGPPRRRLRTAVVVGGAVVALLTSVVLAVTVGAADIAAADVWRAVAARLGLGTTGLSEVRDAIVWEVRLPRVLTAAAVGAGLALAGAVMQSLTRNPLADPYLLGLSSGASLGAVAVILLGATLALPLAAFGGALLALVAALGLAGALGTVTPTRTVLAGLAVSQLCAAITSFAIFWAATGDSYREILGWLMGSLGSAGWHSVRIAVPAAVVVGGLLLLSGRTLDAFAFGDTTAASLGVDVRTTRWLLLTGVAVLTGALVSVSGAIGFVGLVLPHAVRLLTGPGHRLLLPLSALAGASFLIWADTLARTVVSPRELPVGVITALVGAPVFAWVLWRRRGAA